MKPLDLTGKKFGRLLGLRRVKNQPGYGQARWLFLCDCGTEKELFGYSVRHGQVQSCGCLRHENMSRLKHGMTGQTEFNSWVSMRQRCNNPDDAAFRHYGGRGIAVCEAWDEFFAFYADMGPKPEGASLERRDNDGGYTPGNCYWATRQQQIRNRRTTTFYEYEGERLSLQEWAERHGLKYPTVWHRFRNNKRGAELFAPAVMGGYRTGHAKAPPARS
jgi:hypothetical protein